MLHEWNLERSPLFHVSLLFSLAVGYDYHGDGFVLNFGLPLPHRLIALTLLSFFFLSWAPFKPPHGQFFLAAFLYGVLSRGFPWMRICDVPRLLGTMLLW